MFTVVKLLKIMKRLHQHEYVVDFPARALRAAWFSVDLTPPNATIWIMVRAKLQLLLAQNWNYDKLETRGDFLTEQMTYILHFEKQSWTQDGSKQLSLHLDTGFFAGLGNHKAFSYPLSTRAPAMNQK